MGSLLSLARDSFRRVKASAIQGCIRKQRYIFMLLTASIVQVTEMSHHKIIWQRQYIWSTHSGYIEGWLSVECVISGAFIHDKINSQFHRKKTKQKISHWSLHFWLMVAIAFVAAALVYSGPLHQADPPSRAVDLMVNNWRLPPAPTGVLLSLTLHTTDWVLNF